MSFWCPFLDLHLTTCRSNIDVQIIAMLELGTPTLYMQHALSWVGLSLMSSSVYSLASM